MGWVAFFVVLEDIDGGKAMPVETNDAVKPEAAIANTNTPVKKRVFSSIQPTGNLHLGNYLGALRNWEETQANYDNIFCIVDLHALTVPIDPKELHYTILQLAALYLSRGLHPPYCNLLLHSYLPLHPEMN